MIDIPPPYGELRIRLPRFVITALRQMVKTANDEGDVPPWTVSSLLESWLLHGFTREDWEGAAKDSPEFKREAEAWIRWIMLRARKRGH
jgi:hypothetical protein